MRRSARSDPRDRLRKSPDDFDCAVRALEAPLEPTLRSPTMPDGDQCRCTRTAAKRLESDRTACYFRTRGVRRDDRLRSPSADPTCRSSRAMLQRGTRHPRSADRRAPQPVRRTRRLVLLLQALWDFSSFAATTGLIAGIGLPVATAAMIVTIDVTRRESRAAKASVNGSAELMRKYQQNKSQPRQR